MKPVEYEIVCAVCYQPTGENCRARLDGRRLSVRHYSDKPRTLKLHVNEARALRGRLAVHWLTDKGDDAQEVQRPVKNAVPFGEQCVARDGLALGEPNPSLGRYDRNHERVGDISIAELMRIAIVSPRLLRRPD